MVHKKIKLKFKRKLFCLRGSEPLNDPFIRICHSFLRVFPFLCSLYLRYFNSSFYRNTGKSRYNHLQNGSNGKKIGVDFLVEGNIKIIS